MNDDQLSALYAVALKQQETAKAAVDEMARERAKLSDVIQSLKIAIGGVHNAARDAASTAVTETLSQSTNAAKTAANASVMALDEAAEQVRAAGAWVGWKLALVLCLAGASAVMVNYAIGRFTLPTREEIDALRSEKAELETTIAALEKRGGRMKIERCGPQSRLCVRIAPKQGDGIPVFRGPFQSPDGKDSYVIPYGY